MLTASTFSQDHCPQTSSSAVSTNDKHAALCIGAFSTPPPVLQFHINPGPQTTSTREPLTAVASSPYATNQSVLGSQPQGLQTTGTVPQQPLFGDNPCAQPDHVIMRCNKCNILMSNIVRLVLTIQRSLKKLSTKIDDDIDDAVAKVKEEDSGNRKQSLTITERTFDPNLVCLMCNKVFRNGEIWRFRAHVESYEVTNKDDYIN